MSLQPVQTMNLVVFGFEAAGREKGLGGSLCACGIMVGSPL